MMLLGANFKMDIVTLD